jgi:hypothetical protein
MDECVMQEGGVLLQCLSALAGSEFDSDAVCVCCFDAALCCFWVVFVRLVVDAVSAAAAGKGYVTGRARLTAALFP